MKRPLLEQALDEWYTRHGRTIVETGCVRAADSWEGDGMSTLVLGSAAYHLGGHLWTVDIDPEHVSVARELTMVYAESITYTCGDSVPFLEGFDGPIDLLYLDSFDYPYGPLCDIYGGKVNLQAAIDQLWAMGEAEIVARHGDLIGPPQEHAAAEVRAALPNLSAKALVLIDDAGLAGGGKARVAKQVLAGAGFRCLADGYQTLWSRT